MKKMVVIAFSDGGYLSKLSTLPENAEARLRAVAASTGFAVAADSEVGSASPAIVAKDLSESQAERIVDALEREGFATDTLWDTWLLLALRFCRYRRDFVGRNLVRLSYLGAVLAMVLSPFSPPGTMVGRALMGFLLLIGLEVIGFVMWRSSPLLRHSRSSPSSPSEGGA